MKIAIFEAEQEYVSTYESSFPDHDLVCFNEPLREHNLELARDAEMLSVFVGSILSAEVVAALPKLRFIATRSTGYNHIDLDACSKNGVKVLNVPSYGEKTVAEHTFALLLAVSRNIHRSYLRVQSGNFAVKDLVGFELADKTIGIIGTGSIGINVIKIAKGFDMKVLAYSRTKKPELEKLYAVEYCQNIEELLARSDVISLHVPYTKDTHHLIGSHNSRFIKKGAVIINTSRGELIDTDELYQLLKNQVISGAGLDVIEGEEHITEDFELISSNKNPELIRQIYRDREIFKMDNVVYTPHSGFNSKEALDRLIKNSISNMKFVIAGNLSNLVN